MRISWREGGHVLFTGANIQSYFHDCEFFLRKRPVMENVHTEHPIRAYAGAQHVSIQSTGVLGPAGASQLSIYGESGSPAVVSWLMGDGEIVWWAGSTPLTNAGISREDDIRSY